MNNIWPGDTRIDEVEHAALARLTNVRDRAPDTNLRVLSLACQHEPWRRSSSAWPNGSATTSCRGTSTTGPR